MREDDLSWLESFSEAEFNDGHVQVAITNFLEVVGESSNQSSKGRQPGPYCQGSCCSCETKAFQPRSKEELNAFFYQGAEFNVGWYTYYPWLTL